MLSNSISILLLAAMGLMGCTDSTAVVLSGPEAMDIGVMADAVKPDGGSDLDAVAADLGRDSHILRDVADARPRPSDAGGHGTLDANLARRDADTSPPPEMGPVGDMDTDPDGASVPDGDVGPMPCLPLGLPTLASREMSCVGEVVPGLFRRGVCVCQSLTVGQHMHLRGAAINGTNGRASVDRRIDVDGDFTVGNRDGVNFAEQTRIGGTLRVGGQVNAMGNLNVGGDAYINGRFTAHQDLEIGGTLFQPAGNELTVGGLRMIGHREQQPVGVDAPCPCGLGLSVSQEINAWRDLNNNADIALFSDDLDPIERALRVELPCGRYVFNAIRNQAELTFVIQGRVHLYIVGDIRPEGPFDIIMGPEAELDLYLGGAMVTNHVVNMGDPERPHALRWYVQPAMQTLSLSSQFNFSGHLHAPGNDMVMNEPGTLVGTMLLRNLNTPAALEVLVPDRRPRCPQ